MEKKIKEFVLLNIGLLLVAGGFYYFLAPNHLAAGGISGLAIIISKLFNGIPIGFLLVILNLILFAIGFAFIGVNFGSKTLYSSFAISAMVWIMEYIYPINSPITNDILLELLLGVLASAIGLALVFNQNASTGGTDIIAKVLNKYIHIEIGKGLLISDLVITLMAFFVFGIKIGLYCVLIVVMNGFLIDFIIDYINIYNKVMIISSASNEINEYIAKQLDSEAIEYKSKSEFYNQNKNRDVIDLVLSKKQLLKLQDFIEKTDPQSIILTHKIHKVLKRQL